MAKISTTRAKQLITGQVPIAMLLAALAGCADDGPSGASDAGTDHDAGSDADADTDSDSDSDTDGASWQWLPIDGAQCRDGSQAGFSMRLVDGSNDLLIYLEGGGACYNFSTCVGNPSNIPSAAQTPSSKGIFDLDEPQNPVAGWNMAYVPYCTGDVHAGSEPDGFVGGAGDQVFVGGDNYRLFLDEIVEAVPSPDRVALTGLSAGGYGVTYNYDYTAQTFPDVDVVMVDDGAPIMRDEYCTPCLQTILRETWDLAQHMPEDCADCNGDDGGNLYHLHTFAPAKYPDGRFGLISSVADAVIRTFYGYGLNDCNVILPNYPAAMYEEGLLDLRTYLDDSDNFATFFYPGTDHGRIHHSLFYESEIDGVRLVDWFADLIAGTTSHVGP